MKSSTNEVNEVAQMGAEISRLKLESSTNENQIKELENKIKEKQKEFLNGLPNFLGFKDINEVLELLNVRKSHRGPGRPAKTSNNEDEKVLQLFHQHKTEKEIAEILNCSPQTVHNRKLRLNLVKPHRFHKHPSNRIKALVH